MRDLSEEYKNETDRKAMADFEALFIKGDDDIKDSKPEAEVEPEATHVINPIAGFPKN